MSLAAGTRLGPYEVTGFIGAGGMGEVYRARDTRLDRDVAIKVLPDLFARDADRFARFEREAKAIAALSHPNILAIHDIGTTNGQTYVVMEFLDGETLRDRLKSGALPIKKSIEIAVQIARGLAAAHDKGLVHRDLKPENVFLLPDGQVKILDFGLAKVVTTGSGATETVAAVTDPGTAMGTVGYMAPEQVRGQAVDARTDLFALGVVLYEMLSGHRAFERGTAADTLSAVLKEDAPDLMTARADIPTALDRIVRHSLEKNPAERFQSARDIAFALDALSGTGVVSSSAMASVGPRPPWRRWAAMAVAAVVVLTAGIVIGKRLLTVPPPEPITFEQKTWDVQKIVNARFAPDGQTIVFSAAPVGAVPDVFVIRPDSTAAQRIGPPHTYLLSVSSRNELAVLADLQHVGDSYFGTLATMTMDGALRPVSEHVRDADWSRDGSQQAVVVDAGNHDRLAFPLDHTLYEQSSVGFLSNVRVSPDGAHVAFIEHDLRFDDRGTVKVVDLSGKLTTLTKRYRATWGLTWSRDGQSVWFSASDLGDNAVQPHVVGIAGTAPAAVMMPSPGALIVYDASTSGRLLVARQESRFSVRALLAGSATERGFAGLQLATNPILSRDFLVYGDRGPGASMDYRVGFRKLDDSSSVFLGEGDPIDVSPDAKWVLAYVNSTDQLKRYPTGVGSAVAMDRGPLVHYFFSGQWFPDGRRVLVCGNEAQHAPRCYEQDMAGGPPKPITPDDAVAALMAKDGVRLLLTKASGEKSLFEIGGSVSRPAPGFSASDLPLSWSNDGRSVFVQTADTVPARIEKVDVATGTRTFVRTLEPPDRAGLSYVILFRWLDDGKAYVYVFEYDLGTLFVVSGVK